MRSLLAALLLLGSATAVRADEPRIYLSWGAAHGLAGAASSITRTCGDTTLVDTLHLSFDPGRACSTFVGMTATLLFQALPPDSLDASWNTIPGLELPPAMSIEYASDLRTGYPFPWKPSGMGFFGYAKLDRRAGKVRLAWAMLPNAGARVEAGKRYTLARILLRRPPAGAAGCGQPLCVEWNEATMAYGLGEEPVVSEGVRFVGIDAVAGDNGCSTPAPTPPPASARPPKPKKKSAAGR